MMMRVMSLFVIPSCRRLLLPLLLLLVVLPTKSSAFVAVSPHFLTTTAGASAERRSSSRRHVSNQGTSTTTLQEEKEDATKNKKRQLVKKQLLELLNDNRQYEDPVLADPVTKQQLSVKTSKTGILGGDIAGSPTTYELYTASDSTTNNNIVYKGNSNGYIDLLEPAASANDDDDDSSIRKQRQEKLVRQWLVPLIPPPLRSAAALLGNEENEYVPMRDLFTSPAVSFSYERGWRQGFARAGFPGADKESEMALEYLSPSLNAGQGVLVDMSCATGLFTRRFAQQRTRTANDDNNSKYNIQRVLGCDYSDSMLREARRRIVQENIPNLELVRLDVGQIPMQTGSVDALHAGAAMHCWPDLELATKEIYRVLRPDGGRYFATTFLSSYFSVLQSAEGGRDNVVVGSSPSRQAFQYFESVAQFKRLMESAGFAPDKIFIEVLGDACVVIRCEK